MQVIQGVRDRFSNWLADEFRPSVLAISLLSGLMIYVFEIIVVLSFTALIFSGELAGQMPRALGFIILGDAILIIIISLLSSYSGMIGVSQDAPTAVQGLVAMQIVAALPAAADQQYATVVMMVVLTTLMTGTVFLALGIFKLGSLARYFPYPVMGGFLAGTGWLLARGGVETMVTVPFGPDWFEAGTLLRWLPGTILGLLIPVILARFRQPATLPLVLAISMLLFYAVAAMINISPSQLEGSGWLVGSLPSGELLQLPLSGDVLPQVSWEVLWSQIPSIIPAAIISVIALLLYSAGLELVINRDLNLNRELVAAGLSNLAASLVGGLTGYHTLSFSALNHKMSSGKRLVGLIAALLLILTIFLGTSLIRYIPNMLLGAVLVYLGVTFLIEWVYEAWFKFPRIDFLIIVSILGVIILSSFMNGVILGLMMAIIMFVVSYSNVSVVKFALSGREYQSRVTRSARERQLLDEHADQLYILKLQGFIFFGTANGIFTHVREWFASQPAHKVRYLLLDFNYVSGLDSTGMLSFIRMQHWCQEQRILLIMTGLRGRTLGQFARGGFSEQPGVLHFFSDLDHGIEWCEDEIIGEFSTDEVVKSDLLTELKTIVGDSQQVDNLISYMNRKEHTTGEYLIQQGDEPDMVFFIDSGQVTAQLEAPDKPTVRLETMSSGRSVGELGFYLNIKRTAAVIVDEPSVIYSLSKQELEAMEEKDPEAANLFHRIIVHLLGERVVHLIRTVNALER